MPLDNTPLTFSLITLIFIFVVILWVRFRPIQSKIKKKIFDQEKHAFLGQLDLAVHRHLLILPSLKAADILQLGWLDRLSLKLHFRSQKQFDFILYHRKTMEVRGAINLTHPRQKQQSRKLKLLRRLCKTAHLPLLEYETKPWRDVTELSRTVLSSCGIETPESVNFELTEPRETVREIHALVDPSCPKCKSPMKLKKLTTGQKAGMRCWVCSNYPLCNGARKVHS